MQYFFLQQVFSANKQMHTATEVPIELSY